MTTCCLAAMADVDFVADFIRLKLNFVKKPKNHFSATLWGGGVRDNV